MTALAQITAGGTSYDVRRAVKADVPAIVELIAADQLSGKRDGGDLADYESAFARIDADSAQLLVVVTDPSRAVVGTLQLTFIPGLAGRGALRGQLEAVRVRADSRGGGLGHALICWAIEESRDRGCALVQLTSDQRREDALRFYTRMGFIASHNGLKLDLAD